MKEGFIIRLFAYIIDQIILFSISLIFIIIIITAYSLGIKSSGGEPSLGQNILIISYIVLIILNAFYYTYFYGSSGQTIGKSILRIKVIGENGEIIGYKRAFLRWIGYIVSSFLYLGFIWIIFDKDKQGWHDKLANTYVIRA
jgi:uncharacterized RDD family membrane protein YckC